MARVDLSLIIPARNEEFLNHTIRDALSHMRGNTEIIVGLDGQWPVEPVDDHDRVHIIHHSVSIGQRAICNEMVRYSRASYIMKVDAHCAFDEGFDVKLLADMKPELTMVPVMRNLHIFDWVCEDGHRRYQGPSGPCTQKIGVDKEGKDILCGKPTRKDVVWIPKTNPQSTFYVFDPEPHFQYGRGIKDRPEYKKAVKETKLTETMSLQGSCFLIEKSRYIELNLNDEAFGSWGSQGLEIAIKTWTSGGRVLCSHKTWYGHCFRTQGADFGFPYEISGRQVDHAKRLAKKVFFERKWGPKQIHPVSWLVERFWPTPCWKEEDLRDLKAKESAFFSTPFIINSPLDQMGMVIDPLANLTGPNETSSGINAFRGGQEMPSDTVSFASIDGSPNGRTKHIIGVTDQGNMKGITTGSIIADNMIKDRDIFASTPRNSTDKPSVRESVREDMLVKPEDSVPLSVPKGVPDPTSSMFFDADLRKKAINDLSGGIVNYQHGMKVSQNKSVCKGMVFYTDSQLEPNIFGAVQKQLRSCMNGHRLISVSLKPMDFGENIVLNLKRGHLAMAKQQLAGLEKLKSYGVEVAFMVEHDCLYPPCHFDFTPPRKDVYYYNLNWFKVRMSDGQALHFRAKQVSGLCAYIDILIEYFGNRVRMIESGEIGGRRHFEPGSRHRDAYDKLTDKGFDVWWSEIPYVDIRHNTVVTRNVFDPSGYRNQVVDWTMADEIPHWGRTKGRFADWLKEAVSTR